MEDVHPNRLRRWEIVTPAMLCTLFGDLDLKLTLDEQVPNCLWKVGRANWAGYSRHVWFVRSFPGQHGDAVEILKKNPKAIVFAPTKDRSDQWHDATGSLLIPLEGITSFEAGKLLIDADEIEGRIEDAGFVTNASKNAKSKKRGERLAAIEKLRKEVLRHLREAKEHAFAMRDLTGTPVLLRRPTQKELAKQLKLDESLVSRCLNDDHADGLRFYWDLAADLNRILGYAEPDNEEEE